MDIYDDIRREVVEAWEQWQGRRSPADTRNMQEFYSWLRDNRAELVTYRESLGDEVWQQIKGWLLAYERVHGRR